MTICSVLGAAFFKDCRKTLKLLCVCKLRRNNRKTSANANHVGDEVSPLNSLCLKSDVELVMVYEDYYPCVRWRRESVS